MEVWIKLVTDHCIILTWYSKVCNGLNLCKIKSLSQDSIRWNNYRKQPGLVKLTAKEIWCMETSSFTVRYKELKMLWKEVKCKINIGKQSFLSLALRIPKMSNFMKQGSVQDKEGWKENREGGQQKQPCHKGTVWNLHSTTEV
jgi:hypothetical protein